MRTPLRTVTPGVWALVALLPALPAHGQLWSSDRPDGHAPIGVRNDHLVAKGEIELSYRFAWMDFGGTRKGTDPLGTEEVFAHGFRVVPLDQRTRLHRVDALAGLTDRVKLSVTVPFRSTDLDQMSTVVEAFTTESSGIGDLEVGALVRLAESNRKVTHLHLGISLPTGSTDETDRTPEGGTDEVILPYPMQLGSGTFDLLPGVTWLGQRDAWSWGLQGRGVYRLGTNDRDYRLGHRGNATGWLAWKLDETVSASVRLRGEVRGDVEGGDPALDPFLDPGANPRLQSGSRIDAGVGLNLKFGPGFFEGQRLALELRAPVLQDLDGPQIEADWVVSAGWQYEFTLFGDPGG